MIRSTLALAAGLGFLGVALGAFGSHGLKRVLASKPDAADRERWWSTGAHYHLVHAVAIGLAAAADAPIAGLLFAAGVALFSGSLYVMTLTGVRKLGAVTPIGGLAMLAGWAALGLAALSTR